MRLTSRTLRASSLGAVQRLAQVRSPGHSLGPPKQRSWFLNELDLVIRLSIAALAGMAVGVEREWSGHASGPHARFAGVRTFFLLGAMGGVAGWLLESGAPVVAAALLLATGGLIVSA